MSTGPIDRIEKHVLLRAPRTRVWRALTSAKEFGRWFRVELDGEFAAGARVPKHLQVLAGARLVRDTRLGRERVWELEPLPLDEARRCLDVISARWDEALARLKAAVERSPQRLR